LRIVIIGGGPAGLYLGLLVKKANPAHDITVFERNPRGATYGWGVVFSDRTLASFHEADYKTYKEITDHFVTWDTITVRYRGEIVRCGGHGFAGISRKVLLNILERRCEELGVKLQWDCEIGGLDAFADCDLLVGADGIHSMVRQTYARVFNPRLEAGKSRYIWLGARKALDSFTFIFRENEHGLFQVHSYPFDGTSSTFIVECDEATWRRAGLDRADDAQSLDYCEKLFRPELGGCRLMSNNSKWINFVTLKNQTWHHENVVLLGDAAHTAHFSIGSGTKLAMEDAISLANAFERNGAIQAALGDYELERKPVIERFQQAAQESRTYFENTRTLQGLEPMLFSFNLLTRSGRITYDDLSLRDPRFVGDVDRWLVQKSPASPSGGARIVVTPPPILTPFKLRRLKLANRVVLRPAVSYSAEDGIPNACHLILLSQAGLGGVGLVMTDPAAVSREGRITPGCVGLYRPEHEAAWAQIIEYIHERCQAKIAIQLAHAGRRGSTRPRWEGLDRPLREGNWPLVSASPLPYSPRSQVPREMDQTEMDGVRADFARAARMALKAGFDMLQLHFGHGYLLASFISPLSNVRCDDYGGSLENRLRFPLEVFDAVRAEWPAEKPISVAICASDCARGGLEVDDAVAVAGMFRDHGCDAVEVLAGQTTIDAEPAYGRGFLTSLSERVRNGAGIPTLVGGYLTMTNEVNTIVASARADLCIMDMPQSGAGNGEAPLH
jgi:anthraniloyl-CoA monooxygenase